MKMINKRTLISLSSTDMFLSLAFFFYALMEILIKHNYSNDIFIILLLSMIYLRAVTFVTLYKRHFEDIEKKLNRICRKLEVDDRTDSKDKYTKI